MDLFSERDFDGIFFKVDTKVLGKLLRGMRVSDEGPQE